MEDYLQQWERHKFAFIQICTNFPGGVLVQPSLISTMQKSLIQIHFQKEDLYEAQHRETNTVC